jgi:hypothetical protein
MGSSDMTSTNHPQSQASRSPAPAQPKPGATPEELDQRRNDDRKSLDAAVSEGWPVPQASSPVATARPQRPYRTGAQTWLRRKNIGIHP